MKKINLIGQRFGKLTILEPANPYIKPNGTKITQWKCLCDCGNITIVRTEYLKNGHTKSCGCDAGRTDITNQKFGRLTALYHLPRSKWHCKCDCGNECDVSTANLKNGTTQSCGCLQRERTAQATFKNLEGLHFGKLQVLEYLGHFYNNAHTYYKCLCDCGNYCIINSAYLRSGKTSSCGCIKSKGEMEIQNWLNQHKILFISQYTFDDIVYKKTYRKPIYDFAILDEQQHVILIIEYNGKQHYTDSTSGWNTKASFIERQQRDKEKIQALKDRQIPYLIIPYWDLPNIDIILSTILIEEIDA